MNNLPLPANKQEIIVNLESEPNKWGRQRFTAYWLDDCVPGGVRGQVFNTELSRFIKDAEQLNCSVRVVPVEEKTA